MSELIRIENLTVRYGKHEALTGITFTVEKGDYIGIVGPNGCGKTTLVKTLLGLNQPAEGSVVFSDQAFGHQGFLGYLPQKAMAADRVFPATVKEIIATGLLQRKGFRFRLSSEEQHQIDAVLERLKIQDLKAKRIGSLSGGQMQRVLLGRALVGKPGLLILDEPTSALDPQIREEFYTLLHSLNKDEGVTILLISHDIGSVGRYTNKMLYLDRILVFYGGYENFCGSPEMTRYFGYETQHQLCGRHTHGPNDPVLK